jgi:hypothetical protein
MRLAAGGCVFIVIWNPVVCFQKNTLLNCNVNLNENHLMLRRKKFPASVTLDSPG